jgi:hypothetical protein
MQRRFVFLTLVVLIGATAGYATYTQKYIKPGVNAGDTFPSFTAAAQYLELIAGGSPLNDSWDFQADVGAYAEACTVDFATDPATGWVRFHTNGTGYATLTGGGSQRGIYVTGTTLQDRRVTFEYMEVSGGSTNRVNVTRSRYVTFRRCLISSGVGLTGDAFYVYNSPQATMDSVSITSGAAAAFSILRVTGAAGARSDSLYARRLSVTGSAGNYGVNVDFASNCRFDTLALSATTGQALYLANGRVAFFTGGSVAGTYGTYAFQVSGYDSVIVSGMTLSIGNTGTVTAIRFDNSDSSVVRQTAISAATLLGSGIVFNTSIDCRIDTCTATGIYGTGFQMSGSNGNHKRGRITGCTATGPIAGSGVYVGMDSVTVDSCVFTVTSNPASAGALVQVNLPTGASPPMLGGIRLRRCAIATAGDYRANYGVYVRSAPSVTIDTCSITLPSTTYPPVTGILDTLNSHKLAVRGCPITGNFTREGILVAHNCDSVRIDSCQVLFQSTRAAYGVRFRVGSAALTGSDFGMVRKTSVATTGSGATIAYGFGADSSNDCRFDTCVVTDVSNTGFQFMRSARRGSMTNCSVTGPFTTAGISANASGWLSVSNCSVTLTLTGATAAGVYATASDSVMVRQTVIGTSSGTVTYGYGAQFLGASRWCRMDTCGVGPATNTGIQFQGTGATPATNSSRGRVTGCSVTGAFTVAGIAAADYADTLTIDSCSIYTTANQAGPNALLNVYRSNAAAIRKTTISTDPAVTSLYSGIRIRQSTDVKVDTCTVTTPGGTSSFGVNDTVGSDRTVFNRCRIVHTGTSLAKGLAVNGANNVTVRDASATGSTSAFEAQNANYATFERCSTYAIPVQYGFFLNASNYSKVTDAYVPHSTTIGIYLVGSDYCAIRRCLLQSLTANSPTQGISIYTNCDNDTVVDCRILTTGSTGLRLYGSGASYSQQHYVANNMVTGWGKNTAGSSAYGIELVNVNAPTLVYNSVFGPDSSLPTSTNCYNVRLNPATNVVSLNNVLKNQGQPGAASVTSACYWVPTGSGFANSDYNDLISTGNVATTGSANYMFLSDWQGTGNDLHSIEAEPQFVDGTLPLPYDLHLQQSSPCRWKAQPFAGITTDIDGQTRGATHPCIGADEYVLTDIQPLAILAPAGDVDSATYVTPQCRVASFSNTAQSYDVRIKIDPAYDSTYHVANHVEGETLVVTFPTPANDWLALIRGSHPVTCSTELAGDATGTNRVAGTVFVRAHDAAAEQILAPAANSVFDPNVQVTGQARVRNWGNVNENIPATFTLTGTTGFSNTQTANNVTPGNQATLNFAQSPQLASGYYTMTCATQLVTDGNPANNTVSANFLVIGRPTLVYPLGLTINNAQPTFDWDDLDQATSYVIEAATDAGFSNVVYTDYPTASQATPGTPLPEGTVYWHVRGVNVLTGQWCTAGQFVLDLGIPSAPGLLQPPSNAVDVEVTPTFEWTGVTFAGAKPTPVFAAGARPAKTPRAGVDAMTYHIQVDDDPGFGAPVIDENTTATTLASPVTLANFVRYYWRVRATDDGGNTGDWGRDSFRTIISVPDQPVLAAPANGAVNVPVTGNLEWGDASLADSYDVYLDTVSPPVALLASGVTVPTMVAYPVLDNNRTYYWQVVARNVAGPTASEVWHFTTIIAVPTTPLLALPADSAEDVGIDGELVWHEASRAAGYRVYLDTVNPPVALAAGAVTDTSFSYPTLRRLTLYYWQVVAQNVAGESASLVWSFTSEPPVAGGWRARDSMPNPSTAVKDGGAMAYAADNGLIYEMKGNKTLEFNSYDAAESLWTPLPGIPDGAKPVSKGAALTCGGGYVYVMKGNGTREFYRFRTADLAWDTTLKPIPLALDQSATRGKPVKAGGGLAYVNKQDTAEYVYVLKGYGTDFYKYDILRDTFYSMTAALYLTKPKYDKGSWIVYDGSQYIYAMQSKYNALFRYDVIGEEWSSSPTLDRMPLDSRVTGKSNKKVGDGGCAAWEGTAIYALKGNNTQEFWKYLPGPNDSWVELESVPQVAVAGGKKKKVKSGGAIAYYPADRVFYVQKGNKSNQFWMYTPGIGEVFVQRPRRDGVSTESAIYNPQSTISLAPNPLSSGFLTVFLPSSLVPHSSTLVVYDALGRRVLARTLSAGREASGVTLDLRALSAGVYLVRVTGDGCSASRKLVVER